MPSPKKRRPYALADLPGGYFEVHVKAGYSGRWILSLKALDVEPGTITEVPEATERMPDELGGGPMMGWVGRGVLPGGGVARLYRGKPQDVLYDVSADLGLTTDEDPRLRLPLSAFGPEYTV